MATTDGAVWVRRWLLASAVAVIATVVVGGATRLTESGLSITEWKPVAGVLPPMSDEAWNGAYQEYLRIPQAQTVHRGITLGEFKVIFWWEWLHRLVARLVGVVFAVPFVYFYLRRRIPSGYTARLAALPVLTLAQGALGWYMVKSGLAGRTSVSQYRLAAHLSLALAILAVAVWTYLELGPPVSGAPASRAWRRWTMAATGLIAVTVLAGAFTAGLGAGKMYNTFPLMDGAVVPGGYASLSPWWINPFENPIAVQFDHRVLAILSAIVALTLAWRAGSSGLPREAVRAVRVFGAVVLLQVALGVTTLLLVVPVPLGVLHQFVGSMALVAAVVAAQRVSAAGAV